MSDESDDYNNSGLSVDLSDDDDDIIRQMSLLYLCIEQLF